MNLLPSNYRIKIILENSCEKSYLVEIENRLCLEQDEYSFSKSEDRSVQINTSEIRGTLTLYTKMGQLVNEFDLNQDQFIFNGEIKRLKALICEKTLKKSTD